MDLKRPTPKVDFPSILSPFRIGSHLLKNRLVALPVFTGFAHPEGQVSSLLIEHYTRLSNSGVAMVVVANTAVAPDGVVSKYNLRVDRDEFIPGLAKLAKAIKQSGTLACLQLNHAGRFAKTNQPLLPSPLESSNLYFNLASLKDFMNFFPLEKRFGLTRYILNQVNTWRRGMKAEDRERIIVSFGESAFRAYQAGFDMIELHGANGYLLCQFLSSFTNKIQSDFGGDFQGRTTFPLSVIREIKQRIPKNFSIGFRLITREWVPGGIELSEALAFAKLLEKEGVAYLSASVGSYLSLFSTMVKKRMARPAYLRQDMADLTREVRIPTIISGRVIKPSLADKLVRDGVADLIGLGRPLRADFQWVKKAADQSQKIKTCINCNWCLKRVILEQGFNCRRWPKLLQERTTLEHKLLTRNYKGLWVVADIDDLKLYRTSLPLFLQDRKNISTTISPTILFLQADIESESFNKVRDDFVKWYNDTLNRHGFSEATLNQVVRVARKTYDKEVHTEIERGNHGVILIGSNRSQAWRERLLYKERAKVIGLIGSSNQQNEVLVPVDLSATTLLVLLFLRRTYIGKTGFNINFIHVLTDQIGSVEQRWKQFKKIVGFDESYHLQSIPTKDSVVSALLEIIKTEKYGTIIMGKRGLSGIKRWLIGSVSAGVLHGLTDQSIFLID